MTKCSLAGLAIDRPVRKADVVVSFVLHRTPGVEVDLAIASALASRCAVHVVVVDNGGSDWRPSLDERVSVIAAPCNLGYGRGHNAALALAGDRAPFHLIANTDVSFEPDVIPRMIAFLRDRRKSAAVAPRVRYPDGRIQPTARLLPAPLDLLRRRLKGRHRLSGAFVRIGIDAKGPVNLPFLSGCFLLARTAVLRRIEGFDPRFFVYGEDVDLSRRLHRQGETMLLTDIEIIHAFRSERQPSALRLALLMQGYRRYFGKWGWWRDAERDRFNREALARVRQGSTHPVL